MASDSTRLPLGVDAQDGTPEAAASSSMAAHHDAHNRGGVDEGGAVPGTNANLWVRNQSSAAVEDGLLWHANQQSANGEDEGAHLSSTLASSSLGSAPDEEGLVAADMPVKVAPDSTAKRRSLVALLSRPGDSPAASNSMPNNAPGAPMYKSAGAQERVQAIAVPRPPTQRISSSNASVGLLSAKVESAGAGTNKPTDRVSQSPTRLAASLSQGVKSLQDRYADNRGASETFRTMRSRDGDSDVPSTKRGSSSDRSRENTKSDPALDAKDREDGSTSQRNESFLVPQQLVQGDLVLKVTTRKVMQRILRVDPDLGQIFWQSKKNTSIPLDAICEVLTGAAARKHREQLSIAASHEPRWISVVYQIANAYKTLHFIALSDASFALWRDTLCFFRDESELLLKPSDDASSLRQHSWFRQHCNRSDGASQGRLNFDQVLQLCRRMGITSSRADLLWRFEEADEQKTGTLDFQGFQRFVSILKSRSDVATLFASWADVRSSSNESGSRQGEVEQLYMSLERFIEFLRVEQGRNDATHELALFLCRRYSGKPDANALDLQAFLAFLTSADNSLILDQVHSNAASSNGAKLRETAATAEDLVAVSTRAQVVQDMTRPLSDYYISSSHNTYLVGAQLMGDSNIQGYVRALLQGARSVELDCWDGPNGQPQVTHGRTLTTKVPFHDVIEAIGRYAFTSSPYPLILSLEVHTDVQQQDAMARILRTVLGDKLLIEPLKSLSELTTALPSPQDLSGKILVKAKNLLLAKISPANGDTDVVEAMVERSNTSTTDTTESESDSLLSNARDLVRSVAKRGELRSRHDTKKDSREKTVMSHALTSLLIYTVGVKHRGLSKNETYAIEHMFSLSERSALKYAKGSSSGPSREDLIKHNRTHLTRVYPSMNSIARLSYSANYIPSVFWALGCQLVSLNWQTADLGFEMNQAMFARNKRCGYVLKPEALREKEAKNAAPAPRVSVRIDVTIVSGQQLPRSREGSGLREAKASDDTNDGDTFVSAAVICPEGSSSFVRPAGAEGSDVQGTGVMSPRGPQAGSSGRSALPQKKYLHRQRTSTIANNSFSPNWNETLSFVVSVPGVPGMRTTAAQSDVAETTLETVRACTGGLLDLCFLRLEVRDGRGLSQTQASRPFAQSQRRHSATGNDVRPTNGEGSSPPLPDSSMLPRASADAKTSPKMATTEGDRREQSGGAPTSSGTSAASGGSGSSSNSDASSAPLLGTYMVSLGAMQRGYHHVPLLDAQLNPHVFGTLFVRTRTTLIGHDEA